MAIRWEALTVDADDQGAAVDELVARGAIVLRRPEDAGHVVLRDPEGNEFCLLEPR